MPIEYKDLNKHYAQYRRVNITLSFVWCNPNSPDVFDCTDQNLEERLRKIGLENIQKTLPLHFESKTGFIHEAYIKDWSRVDVKVKARELGENGKPLSLWERLRYLLTGRYWR